MLFIIMGLKKHSLGTEKKGWKKTYEANVNKNKGVAILISDQINFKR